MSAWPSCSQSVGYTISVHDDRGNTQTDTYRDRHRLHTVKAVTVATFKQNRRRNVQKYSDYKGGQLAGVIGKIGLTGDQQAERSHGSEDPEAEQGAGFLHSRLQQHAKERHGGRVFVDDDTP